MRSATDCNPKTCTVCKRQLPKPAYGFPWLNTELTKRFGFAWCDHRAPITEKTWHISCKCHVVFVWCYHPLSNGCWKVRSKLPLLDTKEIVAIA